MSPPSSAILLRSNSQNWTPSRGTFLRELVRNPELQAIEKERCARNPKYWIWGDGSRHNGYVYTLDPHDKENPTKHFPRKPHLEYLVDLWVRSPLLLIPKSRQIMASWLFTALYLWDTQFFKGRYTYFQSKKEEDSDYLVRDRAGFILQNEPSFLWPEGFNPEKHISYCSIKFESNRSYIDGIPEGGDQIRSKVPSGILSDESAFQPQFKEALEAAKPCVDGGGRITCISSANPGFFEELVNER